jgi:hypothetical protein
MSNVSTIVPMSMPLVATKTRAFFAPVDRATKTPTIFDPAQCAEWTGGPPPAPWVDLGWIESFARSAEGVIAPVITGMPATARLQTRQSLGATVAFRFVTWSKLSMALAASSEHMNVLAASASAAAIASGAKAEPAVGLLPSSVENKLYLAAAPAIAIVAGSMVVVDEDYAGQTGFVGSAISAAYVQSAASVGNDPDYVRRVSFNVGRVTSVGIDGGLILAATLPAGLPAAGMKVQQLVGFVDREGGSFFQEWSALFLYEGSQGDRLFLYYPRLQPCASSAEGELMIAPSTAFVQPLTKFRALPISDGNDGQQAVCYRTYVPALVTYI